MLYDFDIIWWYIVKLQFIIEAAQPMLFVIS